MKRKLITIFFCLLMLLCHSFRLFLSPYYSPCYYSPCWTALRRVTVRRNVEFETSAQALGFILSRSHLSQSASRYFRPKFQFCLNATVVKYRCPLCSLISSEKIRRLFPLWKNIFDRLPYQSECLTWVTADQGVNQQIISNWSFRKKAWTEM